MSLFPRLIVGLLLCYGPFRSLYGEFWLFAVFGVFLVPGATLAYGIRRLNPGWEVLEISCGVAFDVIAALSTKMNYVRRNGTRPKAFGSGLADLVTRLVTLATGLGTRALLLLLRNQSATSNFFGVSGGIGMAASIIIAPATTLAYYYSMQSPAIMPFQFAMVLVGAILDNTFFWEVSSMYIDTKAASRHVQSDGSGNQTFR